jgi:hypothetical protein
MRSSNVLLIRIGWRRTLPRRLSFMSHSVNLLEVAKRRTFAIISHPDAAQPFNA